MHRIGAGACDIVGIFVAASDAEYALADQIDDLVTDLADLSSVE